MPKKTTKKVAKKTPIRKKTAAQLREIELKNKVYQQEQTILQLVEMLHLGYWSEIRSMDTVQRLARSRRPDPQARPVHSNLEELFNV